MSGNLRDGGQFQVPQDAYFLRKGWSTYGVCMSRKREVGMVGARIYSENVYSE